MEVLLSVPKELERLIEYIPEDMIQGILLDIIKESITSKIEAKGKREQANAPVDLQALVALLNSGMVQVGITPTQNSVPEETCKNEDVVEREDVQQIILEVNNTSVDDFDDDDFDDFADLMK